MLTPLVLGALALIVRPSADPIVTVGNYQIELRVPDAGLYAGEAVDVEFRVADVTRKDPIEGFAGVPDARPTATVTMPDMPGMPVQRPRVHREGVPGDYGLELFFPHGGAYKIGLRLAPPGGKPAYAEFRVDVKDEDARRAPAAPPYRVELIDPPKTAGLGRLNLRIVDSRTGATVKAFDVAHTKAFHLMLMSKDLGWFVHEHPMAVSDGTFTLEQRFPFGGEYLVFADVAPKDKGSQILGTTLRLNGPRSKAARPLVPSFRAQDGGIRATLAPGVRPVGRATTLAFRLKDAAGKPIGDLQPYLGANGHLMIVHQDGKSFVHSHPAEDAAARTKLRQGVVEFSARFPRKGLYKAWAQFQRQGQVVTLPFVFRVGEPS